MKRNTITELADCWVVNGALEIKKYPKTTRNKSWLQDFLFDLQKHKDEWKKGAQK